jgi:hypothetical protein
MTDSARYYERRVPGLGAEFLDAVDEAVRDVLDAPLRWRRVKGEVRQYLLRRFPFSVLYRVMPDHLRILAVKHHSRHPRYWQKRIKD